MRETHEDGSTRLEIHATRQIHIGLLPERVQTIRFTATLLLHLHFTDRHPGIVQLGHRITWQRRLVLLEYVVDVRVPPVKDWITHRRRRIAHHPKRFLLFMVD